MSIFDAKSFYAIISCKLEEFNSNAQLEDPKREGYFTEAKYGMPLNVFSHDGEVMIALMYTMKAQFSNKG